MAMPCFAMAWPMPCRVMAMPWHGHGQLRPALLGQVIAKVAAMAHVIGLTMAPACHATPRHAMGRATPRHAMPCHATPCHAILYFEGHKCRQPLAVHQGPQPPPLMLMSSGCDSAEGSRKVSPKDRGSEAVVGHQVFRFRFLDPWNKTRRKYRE